MGEEKKESFTEAESAKAEMLKHNGLAAIVVNGKAVPPMSFTGRYSNSDYLAALGKAGITVYYVSCRTELFDPGSFANLDRDASLLLKSVPDAYIILRLSLNPPPDWLKAHPDEMVQFQNHKTEIYRHPEVVRRDYKGVGMYSMASQKWREDGEKALKDFIGRVEASGFGKRVIAYFLCAGGTAEWYYPGQVAGPDLVADFSPAFRRNFTKILREKYSSVEKLRAAWGNPHAIFEHPPIPDYEARFFSRVDEVALKEYGDDPDAVIAQSNGTSIGSFLNPDTHQFVADFYQAWQFGTADSIIHFARVIKEETKQRKLVGAFYGYYGCTHFQNSSNTSGTLRVLESGVVDFSAVPGTYENRRPKGVCAQRAIQDSFRLRNCIFISEEDTRTYLSSEANREFTGTYTLEDTLEVMKRDFARNLSEDLHAWWFDQENCWYNDPEILKLIARQQELAHIAYSLDRTPRTEIAFIYDEESTRYVSQLTLIDLIHQMRNQEIHRIGAPVAYHFHDDIALDDMPDYKLYVFVNAFYLNEEERQTINNRLKRDGKTILWAYAQGLINPDRKPRLSEENVTELTGIGVKRIDCALPPRFRLTDSGHPAVHGVPADKEYGYFDQFSFGFVAAVQPPGYTRTTLLYPMFYGDDPEATVLGRFTVNDKPAYLVRDFGTWRSIYSGAKVLRRELLKAAAHYAGCHIYSETDDVIYASKHFVTIHTKTGGEKTIKLPEESDPFEVYERKSYGKGMREIRLNLPPGQTRTFCLHGEI